MHKRNLDQVPYCNWADSWTYDPGFMKTLKQLESFQRTVCLTLSRIIAQF